MAAILLVANLPEDRASLTELATISRNCGIGRNMRLLVAESVVAESVLEELDPNNECDASKIVILCSLINRKSRPYLNRHEIPSLKVDLNILEVSI